MILIRFQGAEIMKTYVVDDSKYKCIYAGTEKVAAFNNEFENGTKVRGNHIKTFEKERKAENPAFSTQVPISEYAYPTYST